MSKGKLYLIPSPLGDNDPAEVIPGPTLELLKRISTYVVEEARTVRRYLSRAGLKGHIEELRMVELNEHSTSEAGLPAVADPGAALVELCHRKGIEVVPQVGPSSLMLALMGSGLNGQSFAFRGYLPAKTDERRTAIREVEKLSGSLHQTQIFIETPYRNDSLLADLLQCLNTSTRLCIAADLTLESQTILSKSVGEWKKSGFTVGKRPCVFLILK